MKSLAREPITKYTSAGLSMMRYTPQSSEYESEQDLLETVSEKEIIDLWRSNKGLGLSEDEAWQAIVTGIALDMAFAKPRAARQIEH